MRIQIPSGMETIEITKIKPYHRNARLNEKTIQFLIKAIKRVGFNQPILVDKNFVIVKGHARYISAIRLGMDRIPYVQTQNSDSLNQFDRIADNKIAELTKWDDNLLMNELGILDLEMLEDIPNINLPSLTLGTETKEETAEVQEISGTFIREEKTISEVMDNSGNFDEDGNIIGVSDFEESIKERQEKVLHDFIRLQCPHCAKKFDILRRDVIKRYD